MLSFYLKLQYPLCLFSCISGTLLSIPETAVEKMQENESLWQTLIDSSPENTQTATTEESHVQGKEEYFISFESYMVNTTTKLNCCYNFVLTYCLVTDDQQHGNIDAMNTEYNQTNIGGNNNI